MVLSHSKLKRKRKEELVSLGGSGDAIPETVSEAVVAPDSADERKKKQKDNGKKKKKKQKTNGAVVNASDVELITSNGTVRAEGEQVEVVEKEDKEASKKEKKQRRKAAEILARSLTVPSTAEENGGHEVENRADEAASNGGEKAEQPVGEMETAAATERPLSVREKKGKKKKGAKDRWGVKVVEEDHREEVHVVAEPVTEVPSISTVGEVELYEAKKVYVGGFPYNCTEDDIHEYFSECGVISELDCMIFPDTGNFRGIAFITFETEEGAANALEYDGSDMGGRFLKIVKCKRNSRASAKVPLQGEVQKTPGSMSAYIGNLSWDVTEEAIKNFFRKAYPKSKIDSVRLAFDKVSGDFKGFGHVDFGDDESLEAAVTLNQTSLLGRPMKIAYSVPLKRSVDYESGAKPESRSVGTCYICGMEGHKAHLCPLKGVNANDNVDSKKIGGCYICGEDGHKAFLCPQKKAK